MNDVESQAAKKPRRFRPQFSVATLLWLMLLCGFFCGYTAWWYGLLQKQKQRTLEAQVQAERAMMRATEARVRAVQSLKASQNALAVSRRRAEEVKQLLLEATAAEQQPDSGGPGTSTK